MGGFRRIAVIAHSVCAVHSHPIHTRNRLVKGGWSIYSPPRFSDELLSYQSIHTQQEKSKDKDPSNVKTPFIDP